VGIEDGRTQISQCDLTAPSILSPYNYHASLRHELAAVFLVGKPFEEKEVVRAGLQPKLHRRKFRQWNEVRALRKF
jgi:hypothetical protein